MVSVAPYSQPASALSSHQANELANEQAGWQAGPLAKLRWLGWRTTGNRELPGWLGSSRDSNPGIPQMTKDFIRVSYDFHMILQ